MGGSARNPFTYRHALGVLAIAVALLALLAATRPQPAAARAPCAHAKASPASISARQAQHSVACLLDRRRNAHGLPRLRLNHDLDLAALRHSHYMEKSGCFDHDCPGEPSVLARLRTVDYILGSLLHWAYGENIAWGGGRLGSPSAMVEAWMHSPEHRANILDPTFRDLGVGVAWGTPGKPQADGGIYTTDFGYRRG
jgi:uncharacterized protein YkwD